jgi:hypothetical protein
MFKLSNALFIGLMAAVAASAAVDPGLLNLMMPDAKILSGIQVDASKSSPFGQYVLSQMQSEDANFAKFTAETGFDPRRDLSEIVVGTAGTSDAPTVLIAGRGVFDPARIIATARASGATVTSYKGLDLLTHEDNNTMGAIGFLDGRTALMGTLAAVQAAIDRGSGVSGLPSTVTDKVRQLAASNDAWFYSTGPITDFFTGKIADANLSGAMQGNLLQAVKQASGGIKFGSSDIRLSGEAVTRSPEDAKALSDVVRFIAGLVQLNRDSNEQAQKIATLVDTMQLTVSANAMQLSLVIPEDVAEKMFMPQAAPHPRGRTRKSAALHTR